MLLHPLESAGFLMRSRAEWLKGLGTEVTGSLGKEEASAGSRQNTVLGCGHGRAAAMYSCNWKQEAFLGLLGSHGTGETENSQEHEQSEPAVPRCASAPPSPEGRAVVSTRLIPHPLSHAWEMRKTLLRLLLWANTVSHPAPQDQYLERSQLLTCFLSKSTPELWIHAHCRDSGEVFSMNLQIQLESSIPFHPSKQSLC